ncbi:uncharacterized protein LOC100378496 [Saccoglossus kowalevskii]|uniref:Uncharacterized protein LOC100378496 n=1 Tax=Saccoglossus kowalevskii TaxID=10224 RepID=A0ABM0H1D4_SACKO|nr:PREDICTED: uncharacterized protein LOC100378496 [Saccoglossus kowalevskii]
MTQTKGSRKRSRSLEDDVELFPVPKRVHDGLADRSIPSPLLNGHAAEFNGNSQNHGCMDGSSFQNGIGSSSSVQSSPGLPQSNCLHGNQCNHVTPGTSGMNAGLSSHHDAVHSNANNSHYDQINQILREAHFQRKARKHSHISEDIS